MAWGRKYLLLLGHHALRDVKRLGAGAVSPDVTHEFEIGYFTAASGGGGGGGWGCRFGQRRRCGQLVRSGLGKLIAFERREA